MVGWPQNLTTVSLFLTFLMLFVFVHWKYDTQWYATGHFFSATGSLEYSMEEASTPQRWANTTAPRGPARQCHGVTEERKYIQAQERLSCREVACVEVFLEASGNT